VIGVSYLAVAAYVGTQSILHLVGGSRPHGSPFGIALTAAAAVVMTMLGLWKGRVAAVIRNRVLAAEARFSLIDAALSLTVLAGLALNAAFGWWWADPAVALLLAVLAVREGMEGLTSSDADA
jgi:divalent metal cation (Fe/Co/Zn/Cd) transporter